MTRCYNFCAGPAALPEPVLETARDEMLDWHGRGLSLMEMSHRSPEVVGVAERAEQTLRRLLNVPEDYAVLFLQGGASTQFAAVPLNLLGDRAGADYVRLEGPGPDDAMAVQRFRLDNGLTVHITENHETPRFYAYPSGRYDDRTIAVLKSANYWGAVITEQGATHTSDGLFELDRVRIRGRHTLEDFEKLMDLDW